jgi:hypothetical protein
LLDFPLSAARLPLTWGPWFCVPAFQRVCPFDELGLPQRSPADQGMEKLCGNLRKRPNLTIFGEHFTGDLQALARSTLRASSPVSRARKLHPQRSLSLLLSNLSSTSSKASGPTRTSPEKGYSRRPILKRIKEMTKANAATISVCASVLSNPNR